MKTLLRLAFPLVLVSASLTAHAAGDDATELARARAELVERFKNGETDENNAVKQLRAKITALEYVAQNSATPRESEARVISVNFPGGPFSALVAAADKTSASGFNVVGEKADLAIELPPFSIRNADPTSLAAALNELIGARGYTLQQSSRPSAGQAPVFTLHKISEAELGERARYNAQRSGQQGQFQSFQLAPYLGGQSVDDIIGAIRAAWELDPAHAAAQLRLKFHPPTGILLVSGPPEGINAVQNILRELRRGTEETVRPTPKPQSSTAEGKKLEDLADANQRRRTEHLPAPPLTPETKSK